MNETCINFHLFVSDFGDYNILQIRVLCHKLNIHSFKILLIYLCIYYYYYYFNHCFFLPSSPRYSFSLTNIKGKVEKVQAQPLISAKEMIRLATMCLSLKMAVASLPIPNHPQISLGSHPYQKLQKYNREFWEA